jgi:hypothetical protein
MSGLLGTGKELIVAAVKVYSSDNALRGCQRESGPFPTALGLLVAARPHVAAKFQLAYDISKRAHIH